MLMLTVYHIDKQNVSCEGNDWHSNGNMWKWSAYFHFSQHLVFYRVLLNLFYKICRVSYLFNIDSSLSTLSVANEPLYKSTILKHRWMVLPDRQNIILNHFRTAFVYMYFRFFFPRFATKFCCIWAQIFLQSFVDFCKLLPIYFLVNSCIESVEILSHLLLS